MYQGAIRIHLADRKPQQQQQQQLLKIALFKGPGKRGHFIADTLLPMMLLGLRKLGNICCGHKMFLNKIRNIFCPGQKIGVRNKCCARANGETFMSATMRPQHCVLVCQGPNYNDYDDNDDDDDDRDYYCYCSIKQQQSYYYLSHTVIYPPFYRSFLNHKECKMSYFYAEKLMQIRCHKQRRCHPDSWSSLWDMEFYQTL